MGRKELGKKESILLGIGLSVRFSTTIIITKILFQEGLIGVELYSIIVSSSIIFNFIVPFLFSNLLVKWKIVNNRGIYEILKSGPKTSTEIHNGLGRNQKAEVINEALDELIELGYLTLKKVPSSGPKPTTIFSLNK